MSTHFTLEIKLGNAAMREGWDIRRALEDAAQSIDEYRMILDDNNDLVSTPHGTILDLNGNVVGGWRVRETREDGTLSEQVYDALMAHGRRGLADAFSDRPSAESVAQATLDAHAIRDDWRRSGEQVRALITEAVQRDRGEI